MNVWTGLLIGAGLVLFLCWIFPPFQLVVLFYVLFCMVCG